MRRKGKKGRAGMVLAALGLLCMLAFLLARYVDARLMPVAAELAAARIQADTNRVYARALAYTITARGLTSEDFYSKRVDAAGRVADLSVNVLLVNEICAALAEGISDGLSAGVLQAAEVPLGALLGVQALANAGPRYRLRVQPVGGVLVDYASSFEAVGINQVKLEIWLTIESAVRIANPLRQEEIKLSRRVPLVHTVFSGEIPAVFWGE